MTHRAPAGFTLIEVMICIAILAILLAIPISARNGVHSLAAEADYRTALRQARFQIDALRHVPYDDLPPRVVRVAQNGEVTLDVPFLVPGSLRLRTADGRDLAARRVDEAHGRVWLDPSLAASSVIVDYTFYAADQGEAHSLAPGTATCTLDNTPVLAVSGVYVASGERLEPLASSMWSLEPQTGRLKLPLSAGGHVVRVDYMGARVRNRVSGRFLDERFVPCDGIGAFKQLHVEESYGGDVGRLRLEFLAVAP